MSEKVAISVKNVYKSFKLPHEKPSGLKQAVIKFRPGKKYEVQHVLDDISFDIKEGEFFGIVGRNGSGKSTLLKLLAQIYVPNKGTVSINGSLTPFIELGVGFNMELTGRENVYLNGALLGFDRKQVDAIYEDIVSFAELERFMDQKLKNYSSGMQVRLAFSIAIRAESDILLIDEVLAVGDAAFQQKCFNYFEELKRKKRTVILVTHDMSAVKRFCTRALIIDQGIIKKIGDPSDIADVYTGDNIESAIVANEKSTKEPKFTSTIKVEIVEQTPSGLMLEFEYKSKHSEEPYIGISILSTGVVIAEASTAKELKLKSDGRVKYFLTTENLNRGSYQLTCALLLVKNKELIGIGKEKMFTVKGERDISKGGPLKLRDGWTIGE